jgi:hypothetical protein
LTEARLKCALGEREEQARKEIHKAY